MTKYTALIFIITLRIIFHPENVKTEIPPFASPTSVRSTTFSQPQAKFISINGTINDDKVTLIWHVSDNETAELFEVEKSNNGINFSLAALVFSSEKTKQDQYQFYEKNSMGKLFYRIKLINKNKEAAYSKIIEIHAEA